MKGLQGERLRQAFAYLDKDQDGFIRPEHFKRIILVCELVFFSERFLKCLMVRKLLVTNFQMWS
jgi:Ca2+-binding EF-hand superfamily protein